MAGLQQTSRVELQKNKCIIMNKNDIFEIEITDMGVDGEGIGKHEGMTFFVKDAIIGDRILAKATKLKKNYGYARLEKLLEPSPYRVPPKCPLSRQCGGCQIQPMAYEKQLEFKAQKVKNNLVRLGSFEEFLIDSVMEPVVGMEDPFRYRNKAQFPVGLDKDGRIVTGFYAARTHNIIPVSDCLLGVRENAVILEAVKAFMEENHILPYDETTRKGVIRHILIRYGFTTREIMVCLIINQKSLPHQDHLIEKLRPIEGLKSVSVNINTENTNVILGKETLCIWGEPTITDYIHLRDTSKDFALTDTAIAYKISPQSFYQVNPVQTEKLYSLAMDYAGLTGRETVWDLYCGIGTISLFLSQRAKKVYGVEIVPQAIEDARNNARMNGITNAEFFVGKAEEVLPDFYENHRESDTSGMSSPDVIVVDPPRKGCDEKCLATMLKMQPERIVYVSCDSATLARDLRILVDGGYELKRVRPVDQFGHTMHVETVVLLSKLKSTKTIEVDLELSELDLTKAESKATYAEIKQYVLEKFDLKVSQLYIAQVKREFGLIERINYNVGEGKNHVPQVTPEKRDAIIDALKYYQMI